MPKNLIELKEYLAKDGFKVEVRRGRIYATNGKRQKFIGLVSLLEKKGDNEEFFKDKLKEVEKYLDPFGMKKKEEEKEEVDSSDEEPEEKEEVKEEKKEERKEKIEEFIKRQEKSVKEVVEEAVKEANEENLKSIHKLEEVILNMNKQELQEKKQKQMESKKSVIFGDTSYWGNNEIIEFDSRTEELLDGIYRSLNPKRTDVPVQFFSHISPKVYEKGFEKTQVYKNGFKVSDNQTNPEMNKTKTVKYF